LVGDGGGKARSLPKPMVGAQPVARALATFYKIADGWGVTLYPAIVNGQPGFRSLAPDGKLVNVVQVDVADGKVQRIHSMLNPDKLSHIGLVSDLALRPGYAT
jgi:RNA polymerase sigma-70 factor (ECF subfamily)